MIKKILASSLLFLASLSSMAKNGYKIDVKFKEDLSDSVVYLAYYFGKHLPSVFKVDSAVVTNKKKITFQRNEKITGGIYMIIYNHNSRLTEFVLENGSQFEVNIDNSKNKARELDGLSFKNSPENDRYLVYNRLMESMAERHKGLNAELEKAKNAADSQKVTKGFEALAEEQTNFRRNYIRQYPNTLLTAIFKAVQMPEVPRETHYLEDGVTVDSNFAYDYIRAHYWDNFDLQDDRLIHTPIFETKLTDYFEKWLYQIPDTLKQEADIILAKTKGTEELFKYTLRTLTNNSLKSKVMGMDEFFIHLVENYYMKGAATWLDSAGLAWYADRARKFKPNVIGNIAPELNMQDVFTFADIPLHSVKAKYTLLVIWSYDCGTCQKEVPQLDSLYRNELKKRGVKVYSVASGGELSEILKFIDKHKIQEWTNVADIHNNTDFKNKYDAFATPRLYLLDEQKRIIGKGLDHSNVLTVLEWNEKKSQSR
jgi:thiol-disulfide isomerase/thioredoxin